MNAKEETRPVSATVPWLVCAFILPLICPTQPCDASDIYTDTIIGPGDAYDYLYIHDSPPDHTYVRMVGGSVYDLFVLDASRFTITDGQITDLYAKNHSIVWVTGGAIGDLMGYDTATVHITGGVIPNGVQAEQSSTLNIGGGVISSCVYASDSGTINIYGGRIADYLVAMLSSTINVYGCNLEYDPDATTPNPWGPGVWPGGRISGQWSDGSPFTINLVDNLGGSGTNDTFAHVNLHEARIIYVDDDAPAPGDGLTWPTAYRYLQDALMFAAPGDEIHVAQGIQKPDEFALSDRPSRGRYETFEMKTGVAIRGGYAGIGAPDPDARDIEAFETILSGDLQANDPPYPLDQWEHIRAYLEHPDRNENAYTVVTAAGVEPSAVLDGCTVTAGHAAVHGSYGPYEPEPPHDPYARDNTGGGLYNDTGSPTLIACTFRHNSAISYRADTGGGAIFSVNGAPTITDCSFVENAVFSGDVGSYGGAIRSVNSSVTLTRCAFTANNAQGFDSEYYGGAIYNENGDLTLNDCTFAGNHADWGGAIDAFGTITATRCTFADNHVNDSGGAIITGGLVTLVTCEFTNNQAFSAGGAVLCGWNRKIRIMDCTFNDNDAREGGAVYSGYKTPITIEDSTFTGNSAIWGGGVNNSGALRTDPNGLAVLTANTFVANTASYGGAVYNESNRLVTVRDCLLKNNTALKGGAVYNYESYATLLGCTFTANSVAGEPNPDGGAVFNYGGEQHVSHCLFSGNCAQSGGGDIYDLWCTSYITHCTFAGGSDARWGPAIYIDEAHTRIRNCIVTGSQSPIFDYDGFHTVTYSNVTGGYPGTGNIDVDPLFAAPGYWDPNGTPDDANDDTWVEGDYHLKSRAGRYDPDTGAWTTEDVTSPCIDAGDPLAPVGLEPFPNGGFVNMGAYGATTEASKTDYGGPPCETIVAGDINGDCKVNFTDIAILLIHWLEDNNP